MSNWNQYDHSQMSPCKDCEDRHNGCHSTCEDYKVFRREIDKVNNLRNKAKSKESTYTDYKIDGINKELKRKRYERS